MCGGYNGMVAPGGSDVSYRTVLGAIERSIVDEKNAGQGDAVATGDLALAAAAAILIYLARPELREQMERCAGARIGVLRECCPSLRALL